MIPEFLHGRNVHFLVGRMHTSQRRTERNHVKSRILFQEKAAFETGMNSFHGRGYIV